MKILLASLLLTASSAFGVVNYTNYRVVNLETTVYSYWQKSKIQDIEASMRHVMTALDAQDKWQPEGIEKFVRCYAQAAAKNMDAYQCKDLLGPFARSYNACNKESKGALVIRVTQDAGPCTRILHP